MKISKSVAYLHGNLTQTGMTNNVMKSLAISLSKIEYAGKNSIRIDCGKVRSADISGLQLLYVWMQCARFRGVEPELVNLSGTLQQSIHTLGLEDNFICNGTILETSVM